ncbi:hypothetical protein EV644_13054 [Kribbella orskensis]|uniref:Uncharacterized protein n=2 Tax=Kribbellaceae TaxID=2726069 RepID=A0ABY2BAF2_9ACTN|nr:hypothetical protein EV642_13254 [Kribbella sp. VKM Ac-2500]TCO11612.1 hypothetical protein EV644_13054 [Kribbella orskensis]
MDYELRAELMRRAEADGAAVKAFLAAAESYRDLPILRSGARPVSPWPYTLLEWSPVETAPGPVRRVVEVVRGNVAWLREVVEGRGWPGRSVVGVEGVDAAWLILQHAGSGVPTLGTAENLAFQAAVVPLLREAVGFGEAHPRHLAHVVDSLCERRDERPQYAVLMSAYSVRDGRAVFPAGFDHVGIERRRAGVGLISLAEEARRRAEGERFLPAAGHAPEPWPET